MISSFIVSLLFRGSPPNISFFIVSTRVYPVYGVLAGWFKPNLFKKLVKGFKEKLHAFRTISMIFVVTLLETAGFSHIVRVILSRASHAVRVSSKLLSMKAAATSAVSILNGGRTTNLTLSAGARPNPLTPSEVFNSSKPTIGVASNIYKLHILMVLLAKELVNYYGTILQNHGYKVAGIVIWHWQNGAWQRHSFKFKPIKEYVKGSAEPSMILPTDYTKLDAYEKATVRNEYIKRQDDKCWYCKEDIQKEAPERITNKKIDWSLFPSGFLDYPIHLQHDHNTNMTEGSVHNYCNAVLWQYEGK